MPSSIIRDQSWWLNKWNADPTIDGMLRMLDTIDSIFFKSWEEAANNLFSADHNTILFQFLKLENFYDPDDLFIKMNARGLPLTEFEIFKGKWMEQIETLYEPAEIKSLKSLIGKHSVNHVFSSPTSIINFTSKKPSYDDTRRSGRDNELLQRAQNDL